MRRFLVIEGLIGAGKTTLCRLIEKEWGASVVLEPSENNPFLEPFYTDPTRFAFPVQMFYLVNRWRQQEKVRQPDLFEDLVVSDYLFAKDRLFAEKTLSSRELELYDRFADALGESSPQPDLVIYIDIPTEVVLRRIARRNCPGEHQITAEYLDDLRERYERLWERYSASPVLRIDNRAMNYADTGEGKQQILDLIRQALKKTIGRESVDWSSSAFGSISSFSAPGSTLVDREAQPNLFGGEG